MKRPHPPISRLAQRRITPLRKAKRFPSASQERHLHHLVHQIYSVEVEARTFWEGLEGAKDWSHSYRLRLVRRSDDSIFIPCTVTFDDNLPRSIALRVRWIVAYERCVMPLPSQIPDSPCCKPSPKGISLRHKYRCCTISQFVETEFPNRFTQN